MMNTMIKTVAHIPTNQFNHKYIAIITLLLFIFPCGALHAEPWIDTSNIFLKESIQRLSDANIIKAPVNTYPLMWQDIASNIRDTNVIDLPQYDKNAY